VQIPWLWDQTLTRVTFESFTDQLLRDRHVGNTWFSISPSYTCVSAQVFKLFLLVLMVYVLCHPINVTCLLHCCLYLPLEIWSKVGCTQRQGTEILRFWWFYSLHMSFAQTCHMLYTIDYLSEGGYQSHSGRVCPWPGETATAQDSSAVCPCPSRRTRCPHSFMSGIWPNSDFLCGRNTFSQVPKNCTT